MLRPVSLMMFLALTGIVVARSIAQSNPTYDCLTGALEPPSSPMVGAVLTPQEVSSLLGGQAIHCDADGLIVHRRDDGTADGGDTAQREGWYWLGVRIRERELHQPWPNTRRLTFPQVIALLEPARDGVFYRHPKLSPWNDPYSKEYGLSRDQIIPLVAAMGVWGMKAEIRRLWDVLPEDLLGKHALNGNWRNFLGQDGQNCSEIKKRGCDATADCSLKTDNRDCSLNVDARDCSLQTDSRDCSLQVDTRSCGHDISLPFNGSIHVNDPVCESAKAAQNGLYASQKATCEVAKASQNAAYVASKNSCEGAKATQNGLYATQKAACEAGKTSQNALYASQKLACETAKTSSKYACEGQKAADQTVCMASNVHSGDIIGPDAVNLFRRALNESPMLPVSALTIPPIDGVNGTLGESELAINAGIRVGAGAKDPDDVGDDLNLIVEMLMSQLRFPTPISIAAVNQYARNRPLSYGAYLHSYYEHFGDDNRGIQDKIASGIAQGWKPDDKVSGPFSAVRWYHRATTGANPQLAELYRVILDAYIK